MVSGPLSYDCKSRIALNENSSVCVARNITIGTNVDTPSS